MEVRSLTADNDRPVTRLSLAICLILFSTTLRSAEDISPWSFYWEILVGESVCTLSRSFSTDRAAQANEISGTEYEIFDRFDLLFSLPTKTRRDFGSAIRYEEGKLYFSVYSQLYPFVSDDQKRIEAVQLNDIKFERPNKSETTSYRQFIVEGEQAHNILLLFENGEDITLNLKLSDGEVQSLRVPSDPGQRFAVWSRLLFVCAEELDKQP